MFPATEEPKVVIINDSTHSFLLKRIHLFVVIPNRQDAIIDAIHNLTSLKISILKLQENA